LANKLWIKVADIAALQEDYYKAIENYERVARVSINNNLMRYSVKEYFLRAGICHLATGDMVSVNRALDKYRELDPGFATQRECLLLVDLTAAVEAGKQEEFTDKLFQYDQISKLDKWKTSILLKIKNTIQAAAAPGDDDDEFA
jgi:alpha-soluble NSF attachment protein